MRTPASIAGHPVHPMIVPIAIGGFILSFIFDIVRLASGNAEPWATVAWFTMVGGIVGALCAAVFGFVDVFSLPQGHVRRIGYTHMGINLTVVVLYIVNAWLRHSNPESASLPMVLSLVGIGMLVVSGWLGGMMVYEHAVGVSAGDEAAPTSRPSGNRPINA